MIISSIELREIRLPLIHFFETSFGRTTERRIILARVADAEGAEGWGECTAGEGPFYSDEWTETAWATLKDFLAPMVLGRNVDNAAAISGSAAFLLPSTSTDPDKRRPPSIRRVDISYFAAIYDRTDFRSTISEQS